MNDRDKLFYKRLFQAEETSKREDPLNVDSDGNPLDDDSSSESTTDTSHCEKRGLTKCKGGSRNPHMRACVIASDIHQMWDPFPLTLSQFHKEHDIEQKFGIGYSTFYHHARRDKSKRPAASQNYWAIRNNGVAGDSDVFLGSLFEAAYERGRSFLANFEMLHIKDQCCYLRSWLSAYGFGTHVICSHIWNFISELERRWSELEICQTGFMAPILRCKSFLNISELLHKAEMAEAKNSNSAGSFTSPGARKPGHSNKKEASGDPVHNKGLQEGHVGASPGECITDNQTQETVKTSEGNSSSNVTRSEKSTQALSKTGSVDAEATQTKKINKYDMMHLTWLVDQLLWWLTYYCFTDSVLHAHLVAFAVYLRHEGWVHSALEQQPLSEEPVRKKQKTTPSKNPYPKGCYPKVLEDHPINVQELWSKRSWDGNYGVGWNVTTALDAFMGGRL